MPRLLMRTPWLLSWLCLASLVQAQSEALPLPPLPPEIEAEAVYLPPPGARCAVQAPARSPAWPPSFPVQQAAHWQPAAPNRMSRSGIPPAPYTASPAPFGGQGIQPATHEAHILLAPGTANSIGPAAHPGISFSQTPRQRLMNPQVPAGPPAGPLWRVPSTAQGETAASSPPPRREFNYVAPSEADEGTSTYMAQFDTTDDTTKDHRQRARTRNFFETGVAGESRPQAGYAGRRNARD